MSKTIEVIIDEDGTTHVEVNGVVGSECEKYTEAIKKALGGAVVSEEKKPEYYQTETIKSRIKN